MRALFLALSCAMLAAACSPPPPPPPPEPKGHPDFPRGYTSWLKVNTETIVREDEGVARELYANAVGDLGSGTVLVKERYIHTDGVLGELQHVAVMKRTGAGANNGWTFMAFDADSMELKEGMSTSCVACHQLQAENDYLFGERSSYQ